MNATEIHVARSDIRAIAAHQVPLSEPGDGEVLLAIEGFALTANNVTYAATGDVIGYWKFFPTDDAATGIVPVWGFARVVKSNNAHLAVGARLYGFFPMASHLTIRPEPRGARILVDASPHRKELPPVYNAYERVDDGTPQDDALKSIFFPLLVTSYLLFDFLQDNDWFRAKQIIIGSASSKTGLGLCKYLVEARPDGPRVVGLTSASNKGFVEGLGACDQVVAYGDAAREIDLVPSVYVDMAGNAAVRSALHHHLGGNMVHSAAVGTSHWDKFEPTGELPGARPRFFFAPAQIEKRRSEWGSGVIEQKLDQAWRRVAADSGDWMQIELSTGLERAVAVYSAIADGQISPDRGHYIQL